MKVFYSVDNDTENVASVARAWAAEFAKNVPAELAARQTVRRVILEADWSHETVAIKVLVKENVTGALYECDAWFAQGEDARDALDSIDLDGALAFLTVMIAASDYFQGLSVTWVTDGR